MDFEDPDCGVLLQTVRVNGISHHRPGYDAVQSYLSYGVFVELRHEPGNPHDSNAVSVRYRGRQVGWVPMAENADIATRLKRGEQLCGQVRYHDRACQALEIDVYCRREDLAAEPTPTVIELWRLPVASIGAPGSGGGNRSKPNIPEGVTLRVYSKEGRTSFTVASSLDLGWYYNGALDSRTVQSIIAGRVVAQRHGQYLVFYQKGTEPKVDRGPTDTGAKIAGAKIAVPPCYSFTDGRITDGTINTNTHTITTTSQIPKENTMALTSNSISNTVTTTIDFNKKAASAAGYLEAGRIANNKVGPLVSKALPLMLRGYADTPAGKLVIANIARMAAQQLRPQDATLDKLTLAMTTAAYQEAIQQIDFEGMLDSLLDSPEIKRAVSKLDAAAE